jgi:hypothetical protein
MNEKDALLAEKSQLEKMLAEIPAADAIDRASLEARLEKVDREIAALDGMKSRSVNALLEIYESACDRMDERSDTGFTCNGKHLKITLPFLDRHNDYITIYMTLSSGGAVTISDDGATLMGQDLEPKSALHTLMTRFSNSVFPKGCKIEYNPQEGFFCKAKRENAAAALVAMQAFLIQMAGVLEYGSIWATMAMEMKEKRVGGEVMIDSDLLADLLEYLKDRCAEIRGDCAAWCPRYRYTVSLDRCYYADSERCETWDLIQRIQIQRIQRLEKERDNND